MTNRRAHLRSRLFGLCLFLLVPPAAIAQEEPGRAPVRLSLVDGKVSFWRPGNEDWREARLNTPLAAGDALASEDSSHFEIQAGPTTFLRGGQHAQVQLDDVQDGYVRFRITEGLLGIDARDLAGRTTLEVSTPHAAVVLSQNGYYRIDVSAGRTRVVARRGGVALVTTPDRRRQEWGPEAALVIDGNPPATRAVTLSPPDAWDNWNFARTDFLLRAGSREAVGGEIYGAEDLDRYGLWREEPTYGRVWYPQVSTGWVPYSTGDWVWDPFYGWTWVDTSPWGWAPFHYGRWVYVRNSWGWAPGPILARPVYAPALVAFFGGSGFRVGVGLGVPAVSWVALGWGEPCVPWWGGHHFAGHPWWGGWGGPRVINQTVIDNSTHINITNINHYENARDRRGVVGVSRDQFGKSPVERVRLSRVQPDEQIRQVHEVLPRRPETANRLPIRPERRPQDEVLTRPVVEADPIIRERAIRRPRPETIPGETDTNSPGGGPARPIDRHPDRVGEPPSEGRPDRPITRPAPGQAPFPGEPTLMERPDPRRPARSGGTESGVPRIESRESEAPVQRHGAPPPAPWEPDRYQRLERWRSRREEWPAVSGEEGRPSAPERHAPVQRNEGVHAPAALPPAIEESAPVIERRRQLPPERPFGGGFDRPPVHEPMRPMPQAPPPVRAPEPRFEAPPVREPAPVIRPMERPMPRMEMPQVHQPSYQPPMPRMEAPAAAPRMEAPAPAPRPERPMRQPSGGDGGDSPHHRH